MVKRSAGVADRCGREHCYIPSTMRNKLRVGRMSFSSTSAAGHRREIGINKVLSDTRLLYFGIGMMLADLKIESRFALQKERLKRDARY